MQGRSEGERGMHSGPEIIAAHSALSPWQWEMCLFRSVGYRGAHWLRYENAYFDTRYRLLGRSIAILAADS